MPLFLYFKLFFWKTVPARLTADRYDRHRRGGAVAGGLAGGKLAPVPVLLLRLVPTAAAAAAPAAAPDPVGPGRVRPVVVRLVVTHHAAFTSIYPEQSVNQSVDQSIN